jgi:hypothetical protein
MQKAAIFLSDSSNLERGARLVIYRYTTLICTALHVYNTLRLLLPSLGWCGLFS